MNFKLALEMYTGMPLTVSAQLQINLLIRHETGFSWVFFSLNLLVFIIFLIKKSFAFLYIDAGFQKLIFFVIYIVTSIQEREKKTM